MANKIIYPLIIKSNSGPKEWPEYKWETITSQMPSFTANIVTPAINLDKDGKSEVNIGAIVSGMPTVFARANMFINALNAITDKSEKVDGLLGFYKSLVDEWRGIISCIALDYSEIKVKRIYLTYSDGLKIDKTEVLLDYSKEKKMNLQQRYPSLPPFVSYLVF